MFESDTTEDRIIKAARELFIKNGYHETSMSAIASKAGLGKGTLYWHFDSKDELFKTMIKREGKIVLKEVKKLSESDLSAEKVLKKFVRIRISRMAKHHRSSQMFMDNENLANKEFKKTMFNIYFSIVEELEKIIKKGVDEGAFDVKNPHKTASAIMGSINGLCTMIIGRENDEFDLEENAEFVYNYVMNGIAKKGVEA